MWGSWGGWRPDQAAPWKNWVVLKRQQQNLELFLIPFRLALCPKSEFHYLWQFVLPKLKEVS